MTLAQDRNKPSIALVLQGGGALGAYHAGAYRALAEHGLHPDHVVGVAIGAINAAVIAGNAPDDRVGKLEGFWDAISSPTLGAAGPFAPLAALHTLATHAEALLFGQPNFFRPRAINPYLLSKAEPQSLGFYDPTPLLFTLRRFADFGLIDSKATRLTLGATNIETGTLETFDSQASTLGPEHVLASASVPPGFPATRVGDKLFWDGASVATSPLETIIGDTLLPQPHLVVVVIDLWSGTGPAPTNMREVLWRSKQIQLASRTSAHIEALAAKLNYRYLLRELEAGSVIPAANSDATEEETDHPTATRPIPGRVDLIHVVRQTDPGELPNSDADFSKTSIAKRREAGYAELKAVLEAEPWLRHPLPSHACALVHRIGTGKAAPSVEATRAAAAA